VFGWFLQHINKLTACCFHPVGCPVDLCIKVAMCKISQHTNDQSTDADVISLIYIASAIWLMEGLLMVANSFNSITSPTIVPTNPNKGAIRGNNRKHGQVLFHFIHFQFANNFHASFNGINRFTNPLESFIDHSCNGIVGVFCKAPGCRYITIADVIANDTHKIIIIFPILRMTSSLSMKK
jgi:hypothetical protein